MAEIKIKWGTIKFKGDPATVSRELDIIGEEAKPQQIVDYARTHKKSELHKCFTWDDDKAAEKWRLQEARLITCNLVYCEVHSNGKQEPVTYRVRMRNETTGGYKKLSVMINQPEEYEKLLAMAVSELRNFKCKYEKLSSAEKLRAVFEAIDAI